MGVWKKGFLQLILAKIFGKKCINQEFRTRLENFSICFRVGFDRYCQKVICGH